METEKLFIVKTWIGCVFTQTAFGVAFLMYIYGLRIDSLLKALWF